ncbi:hypothetical protein U1Q18_006561 [Sarracenia purpurea var. burkii]
MEENGTIDKFCQLKRRGSARRRGATAQAERWSSAMERRWSVKQCDGGLYGLSVDRREPRRDGEREMKSGKRETASARLA